MDNAIQELLEQAREGGLTLPYPAVAIVAMEIIGAMVDLRTGAILFGGVDLRCMVPTLLGKALSVVLAAEDQGQTQRDEWGRFIGGNAWARVGWAALVIKCFGGDVAAAKAWLGQLGVWAYGQQCLNPYWPVKACFQVHPGSPAQFMVGRQAALAFTLNDVPELAF